MFKKREFNKDIKNIEGQEQASEEVINKLLEIEKGDALEVGSAFKRTKFSADFLEKEENQEKVKQILCKNILNGEAYIVSAVERKFSNFSRTLRDELSEDNEFQRKIKQKLIEYLSAGNLYGVDTIRTFINNRYFFENEEVQDAATKGVEEELARGGIYDALRIIKDFNLNIDNIRYNPIIINAAYEGLRKLRDNVQRGITDEDDERILLFKDKFGIDMKDPKVKSILDEKDNQEEERFEKEYQKHH